MEKEQKDLGKIDNFYTIKYKLGEGGFGTVYLVTDDYGNDFAAKVLIEGKDIKDKEKNYKRYKNELLINEIVKNIDNKNILKLKGFNENGIIKKNNITSKVQYFIFELAEKRDLLEYALGGNKFEEGICIKYIFKKILEAVDKIHEKGVVHLDIKPQNILLDKYYEPKISDFGLSKIYNCKEKISSLGCGGSMHYYSPERYMEKFDPIKADVFSLGITLFVLSCGRYPFKGNSKEEIVQKVKDFRDKKNIDEFWKKRKDEKTKSNLFKKLFNGMIAYKEDDRYTPSIKELLKYKWFSEINDINNDKYLEEIEPQIISTIRGKEMCFSKKSDYNELERMDITESLIFYKKIFKPDAIIKNEKFGIYFHQYIKIDSHLNIINFMNSLMNKLGFYEIQEDEKILKFNIIYNRNTTNCNNNDTDDEEESYTSPIIRKLVIQCKVYKRLDTGYILRFKKKEGELLNYYIKLKEIIKVAKVLLYKAHKKVE